MRSTVKIVESKIFKTISADVELYTKIAEYLNGYSDWLISNGLIPVPTEITFNAETKELTFIQPYIQQTQSPQISDLINIFANLNTEKFGLDSNPNNFLLVKDKINFIDFFPLLIKVDSFLERQFEYDLPTVHKRYFESQNIIATYVVRLFLRSKEEGLEGYAIAKPYLKNLLEREQLRLDKALELAEADSLDEFPGYYKESKHTLNP